MSHEVHKLTCLPEGSKLPLLKLNEAAAECAREGYNMLVVAARQFSKDESKTAVELMVWEAIRDIRLMAKSLAVKMEQCGYMLDLIYRALVYYVAENPEAEDYIAALHTKLKSEMEGGES